MTSNRPSLSQHAETNRRTLRRLIARFRPLFWGAAVVFLLLVLRSALEMFLPWLVGRILETLEGREGTGGILPDVFHTLIWILGGAVLLRGLTHYWTQVSATKVGQELENRLRADLFRQVLRLRFVYHDENRSGETIARSLRDMQKARHFFREVWFGYLEIGLLVLAVIVVTFLEHWSYGALITVVFGSALTTTALMGGRIARMDRELSDSYDEVATVLQENVAGARVVRAFGQEPGESLKFGGRMDTFSGLWTGLAHFWTGVMPLIGHIYHLVVPMVLVLGAVRLAAGEGTVGQVAAVLLYVRTVHHRIRPLTRLVIIGQEAVASATRVFDVLDRPEVIEPAADPTPLPTTGGDLRFSDVHFAHRGGRAVLEGVDLHVPAGQSLGILGPTGAGKSTLMHLVPRYYDPDRGRVSLDGLDVERLHPDVLRAAVGLVFQEPFLFSATVAQNIAYGRPDMSREDVEECARLAAADGFINALPDGYETVVGERGVSLSGGQRQRLTIARALAMNPRVLIFDDATASVDAVTEKQLFTGIRAAARGRTTLVISQRVTSVKWCDRIAVLEEGRITGLGTHDELLRLSPLYQEIHRHQQLEGVAS